MVGGTSQVQVISDLTSYITEAIRGNQGSLYPWEPGLSLSVGTRALSIRGNQGYRYPWEPGLSLSVGTRAIAIRGNQGYHYPWEPGLLLSVGTRAITIHWRLNRSSMLPWQHRVTSDGQLVLLQADHTAEGNYSCHDDRGRLIRTTRLRLGHPPGLLNVSCRVSNHSLVLCSWVESVKTLLPAQYHTSYSQVRMCVVSSPPQKQCTITDPTMWQHYHNINITETNPLGSQTTILMVKFHELSRPPEAVTAVGMVGYPMRLQVYWTNPASWLHDAVPFPLHFQLRYRPVGSSIWSNVESKSSPLLITDALAGHAHQLQVRAQDDINPDSQWSDWSPLLQACPWIGENTLVSQMEPYSLYCTQIKSNQMYLYSSEDDGGSLLILLALFAGIILALVSSLSVLMWVRQRRRDNVTKQELTSMVKMKSMPI
uniref:Interleukin 11 receptor subunit alpha n=1 Tax=Oncorhynchus tshawytscha TaxID=74940 RepID=A0AAZ3PP51_ONCTS